MNIRPFNFIRDLKTLLRKSSWISPNLFSDETDGAIFYCLLSLCSICSQTRHGKYGFLSPWHLARCLTPTSGSRKALS